MQLPFLHSYDVELVALWVVNHRLAILSVTSIDVIIASHMHEVDKRPYNEPYDR